MFMVIIHFPTVADPDNGVEPGTSFIDFPEEWVYPVCGAPQSDFELTE